MYSNSPSMSPPHVWALRCVNCKWMYMDVEVPKPPFKSSSALDSHRSAATCLHPIDVIARGCGQVPHNEVLVHVSATCLVPPPRFKPKSPLFLFQRRSLVSVMCCVAPHCSLLLPFGQALTPLLPLPPPPPPPPATDFIMLAAPQPKTIEHCL